MQSGKSAFNFSHFSRLSQFFLGGSKKKTGYLPFILPHKKYPDDSDRNSHYISSLSPNLLSQTN